MHQYIPIHKPRAVRPLIEMAVALIIGIIIGRSFGPSSGDIHYLIMGILLISPLLGWLCYKSHHSRGLLAMRIAILIAMAGLGYLRYDLKYDKLPDNHISRYFTAQRQLASMRGQIISEPYISKPEGPFASYNFMREPALIFTVKTDAIKTKQGWQSTSGNCLVVIKRLSEAEIIYQPGQQIEFRGSGQLRSGPNNFGQPDRLAYYRNNDTMVVSNVVHCQAVQIIEQTNNNIFTRLQWHLQKIAWLSLCENHWHINDSEENDAFISALLLGARQKLSPKQYDNFIRTGTIHFLSISGLHIAILTGFVWLLTSRVFGNPRHSLWATLIFLILFLIIVPPRAPVLRAAIMAGAFICATLSKKRIDTFNALALSIIIILFLRPGDLFNAGFQLSYIIVISLLLFAGPFFSPVVNNQLEMLEIKYSDNRWARIAGHKIKLYALTALLISAIAAMVSMPLTAYYFNRISLISIIASAALMPLITIILSLGLLKIFFAQVIIIAGPLGFILTGLTEMALWLINFFAKMPLAAINVKQPNAIIVFVFYGIAAALALHLRHTKKFNKKLLLALAIWLMVFSYNIKRNNEAVLHTLSIGNGLCNIIELPSHTLICDIGSLSNFELGQRIVTPFLRSRGINHIDALFISHSDIDHFVGVPQICDDFRVKKVYVNQYLLESDYGATKVLLEELARLGQKIELVHIGQIMTFGEHKLEFLWPDEKMSLYNSNEQSLVMRLSGPGPTILFTGDIEQNSQRQLMLNNPEKIKCDILLMPHHGSVNTLYPQFVKDCQPRLIINSMGYDTHNKIDRLEKLLPGYDILHTIKTGSISVDIDGQMKVKTFNK